MNWADKRFRELAKHIPLGVYCYDENGRCPFWDIDMDAPPQQNGYCHLLGSGDNEDEGLGLLWDQCKICGLNDDWKEDKI